MDKENDETFCSDVESESESNGIIYIILHTIIKIAFRF